VNKNSCKKQRTKQQFLYIVVGAEGGRKASFAPSPEGMKEVIEANETRKFKI